MFRIEVWGRVLYIICCKEGGLHKCDVTYVVSPAYKGGGGGQKVLTICVRTMCTPPLHIDCPYYLLDKAPSIPN